MYNSKFELDGYPPVATNLFKTIYNRPWNGSTPNHKHNLYNSCKGNNTFLKRMDITNRVKIHRGCVNTISWNSTGQYLLSGSDDQRIAITNPFTNKKIVCFTTAHRANIFSSKFLPQSNDLEIVSCSGDGCVSHSQLDVDSNVSGNHTINYFHCHGTGTTYEILTVPTEPKSFMSCGEDGTVRLYDLRLRSSCKESACKHNILIISPSPVTAMCLSPLSNNYIAVGCSDSIIRVYDRRYLKMIDYSSNDDQDMAAATNDKCVQPVKSYVIPSYKKRPFRVTSVQFNSRETELLVSYSSEHIYLFDFLNGGITFEQSHSIRSEFKKLANGPCQYGVASVRRLRLRGDWSDTGPNARPENEMAERVTPGQARPQLQATMMHRMTEVLSRMLADPRTRFGLRHNIDITSSDFPDHDVDVDIDMEALATAQRNEPPQNVPPEDIVIENTIHTCDNDAAAVAAAGSATENAQMKTIDEATKEEINRVINEQINNTIFDDILYDQVRNSTKMQYTGHRNSRTMIKEASFYGDDYIMSGSDCGHIFTWERKTGKIVMIMEGDQHVVNCIQPHPTLPILATSGIDYDIKIWAPIFSNEENDNNHFDEQMAKKLMVRNAIMLDETKDTITVPAAFMIRLLACFHSLRRRPRLTLPPTEIGGNDST